MSYQTKVILSSILVVCCAFSLRNYAFKLQTKELHDCIEMRLDMKLDKTYRVARWRCTEVLK